MTERGYLGIDPGLSGAIAYIDPCGAKISDIPTLEMKKGKTTRRIVDVHALHGLICDLPGQVVLCALEQAWPRPGNGAVSSFKSGVGYGCLLGLLACCGIPYREVAPKAWKAAMKVPADKDGARLVASQLLPGLSDQWPLKKHDGRAEAALLALYAKFQGLE